MYLVAYILLINAACIASRPNIVFILTDDQDVFLNGTAAMTQLHKLIGSQGVTFDNMFVTTPLCCPSRSSIFTGRYVHNHMTINNTIAGNCSSVEWQKGPEKESFITYLKNAGYKTFFAGKYLNGYGAAESGGIAHVPPGWDDWNALWGNSVYYNYVLSINGQAEKHGDDYQKDYLTDVINRKATDFILEHNKRSAQQPFFMMLSTPACHAPFTPAPQYNQTFSDKAAPRTPSFNTYGKDKHWLLRQVKTPMGNDSMSYVDDTFRNRWRTLLSVDDMIANIVTHLEKLGTLNNTYIVFSSDNGFHLGQFSLPNDKRQMYEFDVRVPLMIRGPGVKPGLVRKEAVLNIDLAPTFLELAGITPPALMDGQSMKPLIFQEHVISGLRTDFLLEHTGEYNPEDPGCPRYVGQPLNNCYPDCVCEDAKNNTYICVRRLNQDANMVYCGFSDDEQYEEAYDLAKDPDQLTNIVSTLDTKTMNSLQKSLALLAFCSGQDCHAINPG